MKPVALRALPYALAGAAFSWGSAVFADVPPGPPPKPTPYRPYPPVANGADPAPPPVDASAYGPSNAADTSAYPVDAVEPAFNWMLWGGVALVALVAIVAIVLVRRRRG